MPMPSMYTFVRALICVAIGMATPACDDPRTQLVVVVGTDFSLPDEANELEIAIASPAAPMEPPASVVFGVVDSPDELSETPDGSALVTMPLSFGVTPSNERDETVVVTARLRRSGTAEALVEQTFRTSFLPGQRTVLRMFMWRSCIPIDCAEGMTCRDGACVPVDVPPDPLTCEGAGCEITDASLDSAVDAGVGMDSSLDSATDGGGLVIETREDTIVSGALLTANAPAIVIDSTSTPHVAYRGTDGLSAVASLVAGSWSPQSVGTFDSVTRYHMAIDRDDVLHFVFPTGTTLTSQIRRAPRDAAGGTFGARTVGNGLSADITTTLGGALYTTIRRENVAGTFDLAIVPLAEESGDPRSGFYVEETRDVGVGASAATDAAVHVLYPDLALGGLFYKTTTDPAVWGEAELVSDVPASAFEVFHDLVLDTAGEPHAVFFDSRLGRVVYASRNDGSWSLSEVGDGSTFVALDIDQSDRLHLVTFDARASRLAYYRTSIIDAARPWPLQHIGPEVLGDSSRAAIAVEATGTAHVAWTQTDRVGYVRLDAI